MTGDGYWVSFWGDENILQLTEMIVVQLCEYTKNHGIVHLNG